MCVTRLLLTSGCGSGDVPGSSLASGDTARSLYRVLRSSPRAAEKFRTALQQRLAEGKLKLNLDKSAIVPFARRSPKGTIAFLGFELYWRRDIAKRRLLKLKTQPKRLSRSMSSFTAWIKSSRNKMKLDRLWGIARAKLAGHLNYYGVRSNSAKLNHYCLNLPRFRGQHDYVAASTVVERNSNSIGLT